MQQRLPTSEMHDIDDQLSTFRAAIFREMLAAPAPSYCPDHTCKIRSLLALMWGGAHEGAGVVRCASVQPLSSKCYLHEGTHEINCISLLVCEKSRLLLRTCCLVEDSLQLLQLCQCSAEAYCYSSYLQR